MVADGIALLKQECWVKLEAVRLLEAGHIVEILSAPVAAPLVFCHGDCWLAPWGISSVPSGSISGSI